MSPTILPNCRALIDCFKKGGVGVEIGVDRGNFSLGLLQVALPKDLYLIDCWEFQPGPYEVDPCNAIQSIQDQRYLETKCKFANYPNVHVIKGYSDKALRMFDFDSLDWAYLDACHLYPQVMKDLHTLWPRIKSGGWMSGHDYEEGIKWVEVKKAVDDFCATECIKLDLLTDETYPSWAIRKP